ncbi:MAG: PhnD/SsuA/transferrin family substrate-binding protein [Proteobacteria bacterium]|nr:PhnD/SsuA/transferrin family substrate-binding protein [Burkholderiales bacterium]
MRVLTSRYWNRLWRRIFPLLALVSLAAMPVGHAAEPPLIMGVFPRFNASETTTRYAPLADHLSERLRRKVTLVTARDFETFWRGVEEQRYDIVHYNQYHYIRSAKTYQVIAHNKEFGKSTIAGALYVRKDSGITSLAQLRGRTIMFGGGEDAMIGYIAPVYMMLQAGLKKEEFAARFAVNPVNSVIGVHRRQADAAGAGDAAIGQAAVKSAINTDELTVLAVSDQLLHLPWAVRRSMAAVLRESIQSVLLELEAGDAGRKVLQSAGLTGIGKAEDKDYDPHRKMVRAVTGTLIPQ